MINARTIIGLIGFLVMLAATTRGQTEEPAWPQLPRLAMNPALVQGSRPVSLPVDNSIVVGSLTLMDCRQIAGQNNPTLIQAQMIVRDAQGQQIQAGLYPNPEVGYAGGDVGLEGTSGQQGSFVAQEFVTAGKLRLAESAAGHGVAAARHGLEAQRWRVMNSTRSGFYEVLLTQKMVDVNEDLLRVSREAEEMTARLRAAQEVSKVEVLQASIEAERADVSVAMARERHRIAWHQLAAVMGCPEMTRTPLVGDIFNDLPVVTWDDGLMRLLSGSPELAQARAAVQQARCEVALQCAERHSNFAVEAGLKYDPSAEQTLADIGVAIPLRIFDRNQGNIISAQSQLIAATREVERVELDLFNRFAESYGSYSNANRQVVLFRTKVLDNAKESLDLARTGYREGEFDYLSLLTAQRTYFAANLDYLDALQELWACAVELDGLMLTGGLDAVE